MKDIKILELTVENFKGQNFHDKYGTNENLISGRNASGKSTRIAAWNWLISGFTDANSPANNRLFDDKVELSDKTPTASVEALVSIDGETYKIRREAQAAFQRKRGTNEVIKSASDNYSYFIDDISRNATDFRDWLSEHIAPEDMLRFVLSGDFFIDQIFSDKKKARQIIERLVGTVTRDEMNGDYSCIDELLKKYTLDEIEERAKNLIKGIDARLTEIPALIKTKEDEISEIERTDFNAIEKEINANEKERDDLDKRMTDLTERIKPQMEEKHKAEQDRRAKQDVFDKAYDEWKRSFDDRRKKLNEEINAVKRQNEKSNNLYADAVRRREKAISDRDTLVKLLDQANNRRNQLLKERDEEKAREFNVEEAKCPYCGHQLDGDKLNEEKEKFEAGKRDAIAKIVTIGKSVKEEIDCYDARIKELIAIIDAPLPEVINQSTEELEKKVLELANTDTSKTTFMETEQGKFLLDEIGSVVIPEVKMPDNTEINEAKKVVNETLKHLYEKRGLKNRLETLRSDVKKLHEEQKEKGAELADYELQRKAVKDFRQEQMEILSHKVNDGLKFSRLECWSKQKDGTVVADLVLKDKNGVSYVTTNNASRINTTVDVQRFFCDKLGVNMPMWVDEVSILDRNNMPVYDGVQSFYLSCSETALTIESK